MPQRTVTCPQCRGPAEYSPGNPWRPFCSPRCRGVDLGAWASEQYRVPSSTGPGVGQADTQPDQNARGHELN